MFTLKIQVIWLVFSYLSLLISRQLAVGVSHLSVAVTEYLGTINFKRRKVYWFVIPEVSVYCCLAIFLGLQ